MIRAVVWKELREQGLIAVMLTVLGGGLMIAAAMFADPPVPGAPATDLVASLGAGRLLALALVVTAGMVCGGALFAAEKEAGTMAFLDALPTARWALWQAKLTAGLVLALVEVAILLGAASILEIGDGPFLRRLLVYALLAFAWGTLGSTLARTTLGSVGVAIPAATLAAFAFLLPITLFLSQRSANMPRPVGWALFEVLMVITPLAISAWRFTAPDRARAAEDTGTVPSGEGVPSGPAPTRPGFGLRALAWLALRQLRITGPVLSAFAVAFGLALLLPEMQPVFLWPMMALVAGVLAGVTAFGDEQTHRSAAFWAEHRLPIGRMWLVKIAVHLALLIWLLVLLVLPSVIRSQFEATPRFGRGQTVLAVVFHSRLFDELGGNGWKYLVVPAVYGFAFGHLCGLLFRKLVVASGVAVMVGGVGAALWGPSLLAGGVKHWQLWLPAASALLTGRLLLRAWTADRIADRGPLLRLVGGTAAVFLLTAVGIGYRVLQVSDEPGGEDDVAFVAAMPLYDENLGGREFRSAADRFARTADVVTNEPGRTFDPRRRPRIDERLEQAARFGWPAEDPDLESWLERVYADPSNNPEDKPWPAMAMVAASRPVGIYDPPQLITTLAVTAAALDNGRKMAFALLAYGLRRQAAGDPAAFVPAFRTCVMLARNMRNGGGLLPLISAIEVERAAIQAAERWLERLGRSPELTLALARAAAEADDPAPFDPRPHELADRYVVRGWMQAPSPWLSVAFAPPGGPPERGAPEADLVAFAWSVPWEKERTRRLVGQVPEGLSRAEMLGLVAGRPGSVLLARTRSAGDVQDGDTQLRVVRGALILRVAVRTFQTERGRAPATLSELVSCGYLPRLPHDPYSEGQSFGYRVSLGESLRGPPRVTVAGRPPEEAFVVPVAAGQPILWSVGVDRVDQGGRVPPAGPRAEDLVFLVPVPVPPS